MIFIKSIDIMTIWDVTQKVSDFCTVRVNKKDSFCVTNSSTATQSLESALVKVLIREASYDE